MTGAPPSPSVPAETLKRSRRTLLLIAIVTIAPVVASYATYYFFPREKRANHGDLLETRAAPEVVGSMADGMPFRLSELRGKWVLIVATDGPCDARCAHALYAMRQARTMQGREQERIARVVFIMREAALPASLLAEHPGLVVAKVADDAMSNWPAAPDRIYVLDPRGNYVLAFPRAPDIKGLARDLTRLLKASRIG